MRRPKIQEIRNKVDLTDRAQVRIVTKRLRLSEAELIAMVGRIGNSITAIGKEVSSQRERKLASAVVMPPAAVVASGAVAATVELAAAIETGP